MIEKFKFVLENFESNKNLKFGKDNRIYNVLYEQIPNDILNIFNDKERYKIEGSAGKGGTYSAN
jgi:hypothetical protein